MTKIYVETYGCTLNQADTDIITGILTASGHLITGNARSAEVVIINTCTVKGATENKIIERLKALKDRGVPIIVTGCLLVNKKRILSTVPDAVLVWPNAIHDIGKAVLDAKKRVQNEYKEVKKKDYYVRIFTSPILRVPISEGCTGNCYFCQTKLARPVLTSYPMKTIKEWICRGINEGAKEIQMTSMDCGCYGRDIKTDLNCLLKEVIGIEGDFRIRLGMINPEHVARLGKEFLENLNKERMYHFLHMPVQSGSDKVCKEMNRAHSAREFEEITKNARNRIPDIVIATDIIVGYPTETWEDFEQTKEMLFRVRPDVVNVSKFSVRAGTKAKEFQQIPTGEIKRRSIEISRIVKAITRENNMKYVGMTFEITITEKNKDYTGRTPNYKQVVVKGFEGKLGDRITVKITDANHGSLFGEIVT